MEKDKPLNWIQKIAAKRTIKKAKKDIKKAKETKDEKERQKLKKKIIQAIETMTPEIEIFEDDEQTTPTTKEHLEQKTLEQLADLFEEMLELVNNNKWR